MRKTADYISTLARKTPSHGGYRIRIYEDGATAPVIIVTNPTPGEAITHSLSNLAPSLAAFVAHNDLPSATELRWVTRYPGTTSGEPAALAELYESSLFGVIGAGQVAYREPPRDGESPPMAPQAELLNRAEIEDLIGQPLD